VPAKAGIQEPQAEALGETAWMPAFARMTFLLLLQNFLDRL